MDRPDAAGGQGRRCRRTGETTGDLHVLGELRAPSPSSQSASQGNAFLSLPRCGGDAITLTSCGDQGDQEVTADLG